MPSEKLFDRDRAEDTAELQRIIDAHAKLDTAFRKPESARAKEVIESVFSFKDKNGIQLTDRQIAQHLAETRIRFAAIDAQLVQNPLWMKDLAEGEKAREAAPWRPVEVACSDERFKTCDRIEEKTHQECYTPPWLRVALNRYDPRRKAENFPLVTIDPATMNDTVLRNLGLSHLIPEKRSNKVKRMAAYAAAIPKVKEAWSRLETVSLPNEYDDDETKYPRISRIGAGPNEGMIYGVQRFHSNRETEKGCYLIGLDSLHRRIDLHIRETYREEIRVLIREFEQTIISIDKAVAEHWHEIKGTDELKEIQRQLLEIEQRLAKVTNEFKVEVRDLMERCAIFKTSRKAPRGASAGSDGGKPEKVQVYNPGAMRAMWNKARRDLNARIAQIGRIQKCIEEDTHPVTVLIDQQRAPFDSFYKRAYEMQDENEILSGTVTAKTAPRWCRNLRERKASFERGTTKVKYRPYDTFAQMLSSHLDGVIASLQKETPDNKTAAMEFVRAFWVAKMERFFTDIQDFYDRHLSHEKPYFLDMTKAVEEIRATLNNEKLTPKIGMKRVPLPQYRYLLNEMHILLDNLYDKAFAGVRAMNKSKRDWPLAFEIRDDMRKLIREFDVVKILGEDLDADIPKATQGQLDLNPAPEKK
jgi:hypothetical protein